MLPGIELPDGKGSVSFAGDMIAHDRPTPTPWHGSLLCGLAAVLGHLPVLGTWWNRDDWGLLARAQGLIPADGPARFVSQTLYWRLLEPVFGLDPAPWAVTRLLLLAGIAVLPRRLARRHLGLDEGPALLAGLLAAWSPLAFTPLHWAAGVQELLGAALALAAVDLALSGGRKLALAVPVGAAAMLSKESGLGLPLLLGALAWGGAITTRDRRGVVLASLALLAAALAEGWLVLRHFDHAPGAAYALAPPTAWPLNLTQYGWWLATAPWPWPSAGWSALTGLTGLAFWAALCWWAWRRWRGGDRRPAALLLAGVLALGPALTLRRHLFPYLALTAWTPLALMLAAAPALRRWRPGAIGAVTAAVLAAALAFGGTMGRIKAREADGAPRDTAVRGAAVAYEFVRSLEGLPPALATRVVVLQPYAEPGSLPRPTDLYGALAGGLGVRVALPDGPTVSWRTDLRDPPADAFVVADAGIVAKPWGPLTQARLMLALTRIGQGKQAAALDLMLHTLANADEEVPLLFDASQLTVPAEDVRAGVPLFLAALDAAGLPPEDSEALRRTVLDLLRYAGLDDRERGRVR